ncbi:MAG: DUF484 family protein [Gammaproteobacteria bacterium]|nr:DUF484 family protein [Gammaproteobacteria bacterium]
MPDPEEVIDFLKNNPSFFEEHEDLFLDMAACNGQSPAYFYERKIRVLREREKQQQARIDMIVDGARNNQQLESELLQMAIGLLSDGRNHRSVNQVSTLVRHQFNVEEVVIFREPDDCRPPDPQYDVLKQRVLHRSSVCDDRVSTKLLVSLFGDGGEAVQSCAFVPLVFESEITGIMVLGSNGAERFAPGAGVLFLDRLGQLVAGYLQGRP